MNAAEIAQHMKGQRTGNGKWLVCCPAHEDRRPSLSIQDGDKPGRLLVTCFGGCERTDVIAAFKNLGYLGDVRDASEYTPRPIDRRFENEQRIRRAREIWRTTEYACDTIVEIYLRTRGFDGEIPGALRFHPAMRHPHEPGLLPCMVAGVTLAPGRDVVAIHRTYLRADGTGKAGIEQQKAMLGDVRGGAVRLGPSAERMIVAEGIETGLSVMQERGLPVWAAMSASGIENLILSPVTRHVTVAADRDKITDLHPRGHGYESADRAAARWRAEGRTVEIVLPPDGLKDFNDVVRRRAMPQP